MKFYELLTEVDYETLLGSTDAAVEDIFYDSRAAFVGGVFVCVPGMVTDGHDFAVAAYDRGVRLFVCERVPDGLAGHTDVTIARVADARLALALMSARFFGFPARRIQMVALTGTKGKTSTSFMLKSIFEKAGKSVGIIGSNGVLCEDLWVKGPNTTPESYQIHKILSDMVAAGVEICVMEATSQGFFMRRTDGITFDIGVFTNISPDHISRLEHPNFEHYLASKKRIFAQSRVCFVNRDAELYGDIVAGEDGDIRSYGLNPEADYRATNIRHENDLRHAGAVFECVTPGWAATMQLNVPGEFSVSNAMAAICVADQLGIDPGSIREGLISAEIKGRMEMVPVPAPYSVIIDFAHNKISVENLMKTVEQYDHNRIICVFGLEGDRARIRRFDSGEILGRHVDLTILANASPRMDDPAQIIADIADAIERVGGSYVVIPDRREAIRHALSIAEARDIVLLVGKGNVLYEEVKGVNTPFDEREVVREFFAGLPAVEQTVTLAGSSDAAHPGELT